MSVIMGRNLHIIAEHLENVMINRLWATSRNNNVMLVKRLKDEEIRLKKQLWKEYRQMNQEVKKAENGWDSK